MAKEINKWDELAQRERQVENKLEETIETQRAVQRIEEEYQELFYRGNQLIERFDTFVGDAEENYLAEELNWQTKQRQQAIFYQLEDEKERLHKENRSLEEEQDHLYYEKKRTLIEMEEKDEH
ncbi:DUF3958 family protein [Enterococcus ureilyticus]|uniref:DUF3958 family protein n=1 Tax=Enterococcus ureilyticus TaxID=1131292 RepID=UPI001A929FE2|nr:DUF3958 family protein [Enterococcus ureilyticus]MBO0446101.1 DUF3958 family protein [Enterococcus ureilyticus]